jgi:hypothetical protein
MGSYPFLRRSLSDEAGDGFSLKKMEILEELVNSAVLPNYIPLLWNEQNWTRGQFLGRAGQAQPYNGGY